MAANLDKSENSLTSVSTLTYLRGIDASGNSVKISTSDLASVLGVLHKGQQVQGTNLDDLDEGVYYCTVNNTNSPVDYCWVLTVFDRPSGTGDKSQLAWALNNIWVRRKSGTWGDWLKYNAVADFYKNYSDLSSLANALGVNSHFQEHTAFAGDMNDFGNSSIPIHFGYAAVVDGNHAMNIPPGEDVWGVFLSINCTMGAILQLFVQSTNSALYYRIQWSGNWYSWHKLSPSA